MAVVMGLVMSFVMTLVNVGWSATFPSTWFKAFWIGTSIAFPVALVVVPFADSVVSRILGEKTVH
jgi:hypothetical protein